jgi:hypothetical protein
MLPYSRKGFLSNLQLKLTRLITSFGIRFFACPSLEAMIETRPRRRSQDGQEVPKNWKLSNTEIQEAGDYST